jgi:hypothetical protein
VFWARETVTITLDASWIVDVSMDAYSVGVTGTINSTRYARYLTRINPRLLADNLLESDGSLKTGCESLAAWLVCDLIQKGPITDPGIKSEDFGGAYSYTKTDAAASSVKSAFMVNYENELAIKWRGKHAVSGTERSDKIIEFAKLSQGNPPDIEGSYGI